MLNRHSLICHNVVMQFPHAGRPALDGVSLVMPAGSVNVVVGASGSGKSTLLMALPVWRRRREGGSYMAMWMYTG